MNNTNKIYAVIGMAGSGKTEAVKYFEKKGYENVYFGAPTFTEVERRGWKLNAENEKKARESLRKKHGMGAMAILGMPKLEEAHKNGDVVIESLYSWDEYKIVKEKFGDLFEVIAIYAPPKLRYERVSNRKNEFKEGQERKFTVEEAKTRDYDELEKTDKGGPIAMADYTVSNTGTLDDLYNKLNKIIK